MKIDARRYHITPLQFNHIPRAALLAELGLPDSTLAVYKNGYGFDSPRSHWVHRSAKRLSTVDAGIL
jgi:sulfur carrier protein ThiS